jgi:3',5'-cyclic AMP phosphodiesterase CpdA
VLAVLAADLRQQRPDHLIFSGDATGLGFETELARAVALLDPTDPTLPPGLAVPGNHDYYTPAAAASGLFERSYSAWQTGERVDGQTYPFAQRVGPLWLVGVNTATGHRWPTDASGWVGPDQRSRLAKLLAGLAPGPRLLVTHYPYCRPDGQPEPRHHGLRDRTELMATAAAGGVGLWLHGHRHDAYTVTDPALTPIPAVCAGSATQEGRWSYHEYTIGDGDCRLVRRTFDPATRRFQDAAVERFALAGSRKTVGGPGPGDGNNLA